MIRRRPGGDSGVTTSNNNDPEKTPSNPGRLPNDQGRLHATTDYSGQPRGRPRATRGRVDDRYDNTRPRGRSTDAMSPQHLSRQRPFVPNPVSSLGNESTSPATRRMPHVDRNIDRCLMLFCRKVLGLVNGSVPKKQVFAPPRQYCFLIY